MPRKKSHLAIFVTCLRKLNSQTMVWSKTELTNISKDHKGKIDCQSHLMSYKVVAAIHLKDIDITFSQSPCIVHTGSQKKRNKCQDAPGKK